MRLWGNTVELDGRVWIAEIRVPPHFLADSPVDTHRLGVIWKRPGPSSFFRVFYQVSDGFLGSRRVHRETEKEKGGLGRSGVAPKMLIERFIMEKMGSNS